PSQRGLGAGMRHELPVRPSQRGLGAAFRHQRAARSPQPGLGAEAERRFSQPEDYAAGWGSVTGLLAFAAAAFFTFAFSSFFTLARFSTPSASSSTSSIRLQK